MTVSFLKGFLPVKLKSIYNYVCIRIQKSITNANIICIRDMCSVYVHVCLLSSNK